MGYTKIEGRRVAHASLSVQFPINHQAPGLIDQHGQGAIVAVAQCNRNYFLGRRTLGA
jgi:hypothetical protein